MSGPKSINLTDHRFTVTNFRDMVNYTNTTNRGYVRSALGAQGAVTVEKVSKHWYSIPFHKWRSRVDAESNRQLRQKFVEALTQDLKYAGEGGNRGKALADRLLYQRGADGKAVRRTDSLARTEVAEALAEFDRTYNSPSGRREILNHLIAELAEKAGYTDVEQYRREALKLATYDEDFEAYMRETEEVDAKGEKLREHGHIKMAKSEIEFRGYLQLLDVRATEARQLREAEQEIAGRISELVQLESDDQGVFDGAKAKLLGAFQTLLRAEINQLSQKDSAGPDMAQKFVQAFVHEVLPIAINRAREDLQALGINRQEHPDEFAAYVKDYVGADVLVAKAKDFLAQAVLGYRDQKNWVKQLQNNFGNGREINDGMKNLFTAGNQRLFSQTIAWSNVEKGTAKQYLQKVLEGMKGSFDLTKQEAVIELFVKSFVVANYGDDPTEKVDVVEHFVRHMTEQRKDVETALKVNLGERIERGGKKTDSETMGRVLRKLTEDGIISMQKLGIADWTIDQLLTRSLPKIINQNIARNRQTGKSMYFGDNQPSEILSRLAATGKIIDQFWSEQLGEEFKTMYRRAEKFIRSIASRQQWPAEDLLKEIQESFRQEFKVMAEDAIAEFLDEQVYNPSTEKEAAKALSERFAACREELMGRVNTRLRAYAFTRTVGAARTDLTNGFAFAKETLLELNAQAQGPGRLNEAEINQLASGSLSRKWNEIILKNLPKGQRHERFDDKRMESIKQQFSAVAKTELARVADYKKRVTERLQRTCEDYVKFAIEDEHGTLHEYAQLKTADGKRIDKPRIEALKAKVVKNLWVKNLATIDETVAKFIRNPGVEKTDKAIDSRLRLVLDTNGNGDMDYLTTAFHDEYAQKVGDQMAQMCPAGKFVMPDMLNLIGQQVNVQSPYRSEGGFSQSERELVQAMAFGHKHVRVFDHVRQFPLAYSFTSKEFLGEVAQHAAVELERTSAEYNRFREALLKEFAVIADGYSGLTPEQKREVQASVLNNIAEANLQRLKNKETKSEGLTEPVTLEEAKEYFDKQLFNRLNDIADQKFEEFRRVARKTTAVYTAVMPNVKAEFSVEKLKLRFSPAVPAEVIERFSAKMLKDYTERLNYRINIDCAKNPQLSANDYRARIDDEVEGIIAKVVADVQQWALDQTKDEYVRSTVIDRVEESGDFAKETQKDDIYRLLADNLKTWGASAETTARTTAIMNAIVEESWAKYVIGDEFYLESEELTQQKAELFADLREVTRQIVKSVFVSTFDKTHVAGALALVNRYIKEGWQFSENSRAPARIREVVYRRIHHLETQTQIDENTVILDLDMDGEEGTMNKINAIVNGVGTEDKLISHAKDLTDTYGVQFKEQHPECYVMTGGQQRTQLELNAIAENQQVLGLFIRETIDRTIEDYQATHLQYQDAFDDIEAFDQMVQRRLDEAAPRVLAEAMARLKSAQELPEVITRTTEECVQLLTARLNKHRAADRQLVIRSDWTLANPEALGEDQVAAERIKVLLDYVRPEFEKRMQLLGTEAHNQSAIGPQLAAVFKDAAKKFIGHLCAAAAPETMTKLGISSKWKLLYTTSWVDVLANSLKTK